MLIMIISIEGRNDCPGGWIQNDEAETAAFLKKIPYSMRKMKKDPQALKRRIFKKFILLRCSFAIEKICIITQIPPVEKRAAISDVTAAELPFSSDMFVISIKESTAARLCDSERPVIPDISEAISPAAPLSTIIVLKTEKATITEHI